MALRRPRNSLSAAIQLDRSQFQPTQISAHCLKSLGRQLVVERTPIKRNREVLRWSQRQSKDETVEAIWAYGAAKIGLRGCSGLLLQIKAWYKPVLFCANSQGSDRWRPNN
jgi:hypothetical protein